MSPTLEHETPLDLMRSGPEIVPALLTAAGLSPSPGDRSVIPASEALTDCNPPEFRCDGAFLTGDPEKPHRGIIVEVQREFRARKRYTWPAYHAVLKARHECPVLLFVLCFDDATAKQCAEPIDLGQPESPYVPIVLTPADLPVITDPDEATRSPELASLSLIAPGPPEQWERAAEAWATGLRTIDRDEAAQYYEFVVGQVPEALRRLLEEKMKSGTWLVNSDFAKEHYGRGQADGMVEGKVEGKAEGEAVALLAVLSARGIAISRAQRERVETCMDLDQLARWVKRAAVATSAEDVFA